jgi:hypothetical protein
MYLSYSACQQQRKTKEGLNRVKVIQLIDDTTPIKEVRLKQLD